MRLSFLTRLRALARAERGQTAAEFIAMLGVVAAVMALGGSVTTSSRWSTARSPAS